MALIEKQVTPALQGGEIWCLQLNRPQSHNALSRALLEELAHALETARAASELRVLVLAASGKSFCTGADLKERRSMSEDEVMPFLTWMGRIFNDLAELPCPTVAAIQGYALGGGLELALCCDLRVATESAVLGLPETSLGIIPGAGGTQRLQRLIGPGPARHLIFTAARITAREALQLGLVQKVYTDSELKTMPLELAQTIAANAPVALRQAKRALLEGSELPLEQALEHERTLYAATLTTQDRREALQAFAEKRTPRFQGK